MDTAERIRFLKNAEIFDALEESYFEKLAEIVGEEDFQEGDILFNAGDPGDCMYIIVDGSVKIYVKSNGEEQALATLDKGVMGEFSLFADQTRNAFAVCASETLQVLTLKKDDFLQLAKTYPDILVQVIQILIRKIDKMNAIIREKIA
jgi:CRP-like cAMP-binding protein